jgi:antitoxin component HigA of HigAB toxin-antitoxin module
MQWILPVWRELQARCPVSLCSITNERHGKAMNEFLNDLLDEIGDQRVHPLTGLLDAVTAFVRDYEEQRFVSQKCAAGAVLRFLMDQNGLCEADLRAFFESPAGAFDALTGACPITAKQARALAKEFGVSTAMFL